MNPPVFDLDETIHQKVRLGIMALLGKRGRMSFNDLKAELRLTDGNLSVHLVVLERAGMIQIEKSYAGRRPCTNATISDQGRAALAAYFSAIGRVIESAQLGSDSPLAVRSA